MPIQYLKKSPKTSSTDDLKTRELVQKILTDLETSKENVFPILNMIPKMWIVFTPDYNLSKKNYGSAAAIGVTAS